MSDRLPDAVRHCLLCVGSCFLKSSRTITMRDKRLVNVSVRVGWAPCARDTSQRVQHCLSEEKNELGHRKMYLRDGGRVFGQKGEGIVTLSGPGPHPRANDQGRLSK